MKETLTPGGARQLGIVGGAGMRRSKWPPTNISGTGDQTDQSLLLGYPALLYLSIERRIRVARLSQGRFDPSREGHEIEPSLPFSSVSGQQNGPACSQRDPDGIVERRLHVLDEDGLHGLADGFRRRGGVLRQDVEVPSELSVAHFDLS